MQVIDRYPKRSKCKIKFIKIIDLFTLVFEIVDILVRVIDVTKDPFFL